VTRVHDHENALRAALAPLGRIALALSGGVDSVTLAVFANRAGIPMRAVHAASAAVPHESTDRVRATCASAGIELLVVDAGELSDERYVQNPVDRCFFCKTDLYAAIAAHADGAQIVSGTNLDDLDDYRPGLKAADARGVRHPFVEAGLRKDDVRALARELGLHDLAETPSQPCLSSRVETGIRVAPQLLHAIDDVERRARARVGERATNSCRVRKGGAVFELDAAVLAQLDSQARASFASSVRASLSAAGIEQALAFDRYRQGSAFLRVL
jgi:uncharacterized protein